MSSAAAEKAIQDLKTVAEDAEELLKESTGTANDKTKLAREKLMAAMETAKETCKKLEAKVVEGAKATDKTIRAHPYESMFVSFGVGVLVGYLITRKSS
jgi:ElaB/YqjD/DUF883 family membrane-anchored ribosome-binding protein